MGPGPGGGGLSRRSSGRDSRYSLEFEVRRASLCCLPGCPSRPHRPHPLPPPLPLRLGPRHRRCRCLRHSRRPFPPPPPPPPPSPPLLPPPPPAASALPRPPPTHHHRPPRVPALPASQTFGRAPLGATRRRHREHAALAPATFPPAAIPTAAVAAAPVTATALAAPSIAPAAVAPSAF